ncbi:MAG: 6,7-dimethyl-8-ribityllumazine synthase [Trueperaceae bacterium]|nr:6,7-dimethyl-8-ribityllumazine synthase [Trueperaceae bacterium]
MARPDTPHDPSPHAAQALRGRLDGAGLRVGVAFAPYDRAIVDPLLDGALAVLREAGVADDGRSVVEVPGAVELPLAAAALIDAADVDAVVTLGAVVRGATDHYDYVCDMVARGVERVALDTGRPVAFGVLTSPTRELALARAGGEAGNKGAEAAEAAIRMADLLRRLPHG